MTTFEIRKDPTTKNDTDINFGIEKWTHGLVHILVNA